MIEPNSRGAPSPGQIKVYWDATSTPSRRGIAETMRHDGWRVSDSMVIRAVKTGFAVKERLKGAGKTNAERKIETSPEINIVRAVQSMSDENAPPTAIAEALVQVIQNLPDGEKDRVKSILEMDEADIILNTRKLVRVAGYLLAEDLAKHTKLMMLAPDKAAKLWNALGNSLQPATTPPVPPAGGDGAIVVEHVAKPVSPMAQAISNFRAKRSAAA